MTGTDRVALITKALQVLRVKLVTIDGEGVVCRPNGVSDFAPLRAAVLPIFIAIIWSRRSCSSRVRPGRCPG